MRGITINPNGTITVPIESICEIYKNHYDLIIQSPEYHHVRFSRYICDVVRGYLKDHRFKYIGFSDVFKDYWLKNFNPNLVKYLNQQIILHEDCAGWETPEIPSDFMYWNAGGEFHYMFEKLGIRVERLETKTITLQYGSSDSKLKDMQYRIECLEAAKELHPLFSVTF